MCKSVCGGNYKQKQQSFFILGFGKCHQNISVQCKVLRKLCVQPVKHFHVYIRDLWLLPHLSLLMLCNEVTVEVLQGHFGHGDPLPGVITHRGARALAGHRHALPGKTQMM